MHLSRAQQETLSDMMTAPVYDGSHQWCDTHKICNTDQINGNWNTNTLKALERKGCITIIKCGDWWNDIVEVTV